MGKRNKAEILAGNLPQLQNLIKRDPSSYREEFLQQWRHFESELTIFKLKPDSDSVNFGEMITFISHVSSCYKNDCKEFPDYIMDLISTHYQILNPEVRKTMVQALILMQNKGMIPSTTLLPLFFTLFRCRDKVLRKFLHTHIVSDIKNANASSKNNKLNKTMQNYMYTMLKDANDIAAKKSLEVMIDLYKKNVWNEAKTVNIISEACFSPISKIAAPAIQFFLGNNDKDADEDEEEDGGVDMASLKHQMNINKKKKSRVTQMEKAAASIKKKERNKAKAEAFNFSALHLINDPQGFSEKLLARLRSCTANNSFSFELRLCLMNLISRLIGVHRLLVLNFYDFIVSYIKPQQKDVTSILAYIAQSSHDLIPPETMTSVIEAIANNFIWNNCAGEVVTAGLNAIREICARCPLAMPQTLLQSLVDDYKSHRDKGPMNAARSLIGLYRESNPEMLKKKDRGKAASVNLREFVPRMYGQSNVTDTIDGADLLALDAISAQNSSADTSDEEEDEDEGSDFDSDEGINLVSDDDEAAWDAFELVSNDDEDEDAEEVDEEDSDVNAEGGVVSATDDSEDEKVPDLVPATGEDSEIAGSPEKKRKGAVNIAQQRILTAEDFARIKRLKIRRETERITGVKMASDEDDDDEEEGDDSSAEDDEFVDVSKIMAGIKRKDDYAARMESIKAGREGREFGSKKGKEDRSSLTNRIKSKRNKAFMMIVHKRGVQGKAKRSLRDKQRVLRAHINKQKMKK